MSLPILILMVLPLIVAPMGTHSIYLALFHREQASIAVDNAGIVLGQNDRALFNQVRATNKAMDALEVAHHTAHAAAKIPGIGLAFIGEDKALEATISAMHAASFSMAQAQWIKGSFLVMRELSVLNTKLRSLSRPKTVPLKSETCKLCHLQTHWEVSGGTVESQVVVEGARPVPGVKVRMRGKSLLRGAKWNYQMVMHEAS